MLMHGRVQDLPLKHSGKYEEAIGCYEKALQINPESGEAWTNKGVALNELGKYEEALGCYNKALEINPKNPMPGTIRELRWSDSENMKKQLDAMTKVLETDPEDADAWYNKGVAYGELGKPQEAHRLLR